MEFTNTINKFIKLILTPNFEYTQKPYNFISFLQNNNIKFY